MARITIDTEKCVGCGDCALVCPALVYVPSEPPCQAACPIRTNIAGYISLIAQGRLSEAYKLIKRTNPLPVTCGRVCTRPCELGCARSKFDEALSIRELKRFVTDNVVKIKIPAALRTRPEEVAVIGAGPAGLAAAHDLARLGYGVTVFEAQPVAGGMLYTGIPEYRLPKSILQAEIDEIKATGVNIRTNTPIGKELTLNDLLQQEYKAILLATGAHQSLKLEIPGENEMDGVWSGVEFLRDVNLKRIRAISGWVVVIGGGNTAVDSARCALRLGADEVTVLYRRSRKEMPAIPEEIVEAEEEGVEFIFNVVPVQILGKEGKVAGLKCIRTRPGTHDISSRQRLITTKGTEFLIKVDLIITAIGQKPGTEFLCGLAEIERTETGSLKINSFTLSTSKIGVFAAGDVIGPATVIDAIACGKKAALSINSYLNRERVAFPSYEGFHEVESRVWGEITRRPRTATTRLVSNRRRKNFREVCLSFDKKSALQETSRCLGCHIFCDVDVNSCCGLTCRICMDSCWKKAVTIIPEV